MGKASNRKKARRQAQKTEPAKLQAKPKFWQHKWVQIGFIAFIVIALGVTVYSLTDWSDEEIATNGAGENENDVDEEPGATDEETGENGATEEKGNNDKTDSELMEKPVATIEMENGALIKMELEPGIAPNTVNNFISLAKDGFYDGLIFHRVIPEFMAQGGCPDGTGMGGPGYGIKGEFSSNGHENDLNHKRGVVSMARSQGQPDSAGSQFFIVVDDSLFLDGDYAAFGKVIEGMEEADRIVNVDTDDSDKPHEDQIIKKITVETFDIDYEEPEKVEG